MPNILRKQFWKTLQVLKKKPLEFRDLKRFSLKVWYSQNWKDSDFGLLGLSSLGFFYVLFAKQSIPLEILCLLRAFVLGKEWSEVNWKQYH